MKKRGRKSTTEKGEVLSKREKEVLQYLSEGQQYKAIAGMLLISTETVRTHAHKIYVKLKARNRQEAIAKFETCKLATDGDIENKTTD